MTSIAVTPKGRPYGCGNNLLRACRAGLAPAACVRRRKRARPTGLWRMPGRGRRAYMPALRRNRGHPTSRRAGACPRRPARFVCDRRSAPRQRDAVRCLQKRRRDRQEDRCHHPDSSSDGPCPAAHILYLTSPPLPSGRTRNRTHPGLATGCIPYLRQEREESPMAMIVIGSLLEGGLRN